MTFTSTLRFWAGAALLLSLGACSSESNTAAAPANRITFNDFENFDGWIPTTPSLTKEKAHSGRYSIKVQPGIDFAMGYINSLGQASASKFQKITIKGWALRTSPKATGVVVMQVLDAAGGNVAYQRIFLDEEVKSLNKWTEFSGSFTLPSNLAPTHTLKVYLWRASSEQIVFVDDLEILKD